MKTIIFKLVICCFFLFNFKGISQNYVWTERHPPISMNWSGIATSSDGSKLAACSNGGHIYTSIDSGKTWKVQTAIGGKYWTSITSSSDGTKLAACEEEGYIYTSTNGGETWTQQISSGKHTWWSITSSSDGTKLAACERGGYIYTSNNGGNSWIQQISAAFRQWNSITSSSDGLKLEACEMGGYIYSSTDCGNNWAQQISSGSRNWESITSSSDGTKLAACVGFGSGYIYTSTDGGETWTEQKSAGSRYWKSITSSSDGIVLAACVLDGYIYKSTDSGNLWEQKDSAGQKGWWSITSSSDGIKLATCVYGRFIYTSTDIGNSWTEHTDFQQSWSSIASSSDGTKLAACVEGGYIYTSTVSGNLWTEQTSAGNRQWNEITSSSDGTKLAACVYGGFIYTSKDGGNTWTEQTSAGNRQWRSITCSSDGTKLAACDISNNYNYIYTSTNSGISWTKRTCGDWTSIASSSDGAKLAACECNGLGYIFTSTDCGNEWTMHTSFNRCWSSITLSSDGEKLAASVLNGYIFTTTDFGYTWTEQKSAGNHEWSSITSSSDGAILAACVYGGFIYTSKDGGNTWTEQTSAGNRQWRSITCSSDGTKLAACVNGGYIYTGILSTEPTITTDTSLDSSLCQGNTIILLFSKTGIFNSGNTFTAQLSDSADSFANPTIIGILPDTIGGTIICTIPKSIPQGSGYRIRVIGSNPLTIGTDNGTDITIDTLPKPYITGPDSVCANSEQNYSANPLNGGTDHWFVTGGTIKGASDQNSVIINFQFDDSASIKLIQSTASGCQDSTISTITINVIPFPKISGNTMVLTGDLEKYLSPTNMGTENLWDVSGGQIQGSDSGTSIKILWKTTGTGKVYLTQTRTATDCQNRDTLVVTINSIGPLVIDAGGDKSICQGDSVQIGNTNPASGGKPPYKFKWTPAIGLSSDTIPNPIARPDITTIYTLSVTDSRDSSANANVTVTVNPLPTPKISGNTPVYSGDSEQFSSPSPSGTENSWDVDGGLIQGSSSGATVSILWQTTGTGKVYLTQTITATGCQKNDTLIVTISSVGPLFVNPSGDKSFCFGDSVLIGNTNPATGGKPPYKFKWTPATGLSCDTIPNPIAKPDITTIYTLKVTDSRDSSVSANVTVTVNPLPNTKISGNKNTYVNTTETYTTQADAGTTTLWTVSSNGTKTNQNNQSVTINWITIGTGWIKAEQTTQYGCKGVDSITVAINSQGECLSTQDLILDPVYIIPGYNVSRLGEVDFTNICDETLNISEINFTNVSGNIRIKDTLPDQVNIIKPQNDIEFTVEYMPTTVGTDEATIELVTDKGERKTARIMAQALQGDVNTPLTVLKLIPTPLKAPPGERVPIQLIIFDSRNVQVRASMRYKVKFSFNGEVLRYLNFDNVVGRVKLTALLPPQIANKEYDYTVELDGFARTDNMVLGQIYTESVLGMFSETPIYFKDFKWLDTTIKAEVLNDGIFQLSLCQAGGQRLLQQGTPAGLQLLEPNPAGESANLIYSTLEEGRTRIYLVDELGITKKEIFDGTEKSGTYQIAFDTKNMENGLYFIIMETPSNVFREKFIIFK